MDPYRLAVDLHGYFGVLAFAALVHPALRLRGGNLSRGDRWSIGLTTGTVVCLAMLAIWIYPMYRVQIKPDLLVAHYPIALLFEAKEHLGFYVVVLALGAGALAWTGADPESARTAYRLAAGLAVLVVAAGTVVGAFHG